MGVLRWLRHEHAVRVGGRLDEVVGAHVSHDLGAGEDLDVELLLQLAQRLGFKHRHSQQFEFAESRLWIAMQWKSVL